METEEKLKNLDNKGLFLLETSSICFNHCIRDIKLSEINQSERICLLDCFAKMSYSYSNYFNK